MPIRVGIDLVFADSVRESLNAHGERYLRRVFTPAEVTDCTTSSGPDPARLAARFAAKEATMKVLRVGDRALPWRDVEVRRDPAGWVILSLTGSAADLASREGVASLSLSLTHRGTAAAAVVIAEIEQPADT